MIDRELLAKVRREMDESNQYMSPEYAKKYHAVYEQFDVDELVYFRRTTLRGHLFMEDLELYGEEIAQERWDRFIVSHDPDAVKYHSDSSEEE